MAIEQIIFDISEALRTPVLVLAALAMLVVVGECGALIVELWHRRHRKVERTEQLVAATQAALAQGDTVGATAIVDGIARTAVMGEVLRNIVLQLSQPQAEERISKRLADFEYGQIRRLERTRMLVRFGPALGLMGTLIPLSPALSGLADGNVAELTDNLRVAFSVTVIGLIVGAIAFALSLIRDRIYGQDFSDVQYVAAILTADEGR